MEAEHRQCQCRGYTLIELLLALAVLSVVATIVLPSFFSSHFKRRAMDQAIASVMESILQAKQLAIQSATPYAYEFTRGTNLQSIYPLDGSRTKQTISLPSTIRLETNSKDIAGSNRMIFREDGSTEGLTFLVVGSNMTQPIQVHRRLGIPQRVTIE